MPAKRSYELQPLNPELVLIYAYVLELNKKTSDAVRMYEKLYRLNPTNEDLIARMLYLYRETGGLKEALSILDEMAERPEGDSPSIHIQRAYILWDLKEYEKAAKILIELAKNHTADERIRYLAGLGYDKIGQKEDAIKMFETISPESEFKRHAQYRIVYILKGQKKFDQALDKLGQLSKADDTEETIYLLKANIHAEMKDYDKAISTLESALDKFPNENRIIFMIGVNEEKAGDIKACIETMKKVIKIDPQHNIALNFLGYLYAEQGENLDEAEKLIKKALELKPNDGYYLDSLGWVYFQKGDYNKALKILVEALKIIPKEGVVLEHIGDVYRVKKKTAEAKKYYIESLKTELIEKDKKRIEKKLEELNVAKGADN